MLDDFNFVYRPGREDFENWTHGPHLNKTKSFQCFTIQFSLLFNHTTAIPLFIRCNFGSHFVCNLLWLLENWFSFQRSRDASYCTNQTVNVLLKDALTGAVYENFDSMLESSFLPFEKKKQSWYSAICFIFIKHGATKLGSEAKSISCASAAVGEAKLNENIEQYAEWYAHFTGLTSVEAIEKARSLDLRYGTVDWNYVHLVILWLMKADESWRQL